MKKPQKINKNSWVTSNDLGNSYAGWEVSFPYPKDDIEMNRLLRLFKEISIIGEETEIYHIEKVDPESSIVTPCTYSDELEKIFLESGELHSFGVDHGIKYKLKYLCSSKLRYYDSQGNTQEEFVKDMRSLLLDNHLVSLSDSNVHLIYSTPPILISIYAVDLKYNSKHQLDTFEISINLHTDIWFPWVKGFLEDDISSINTSIHPILGVAYDNREIANYHTPRLNKFLQKISGLIVHYGGTWEKGGDTQAYEEMFTIEGIIID